MRNVLLAAILSICLIQGVFITYYALSGDFSDTLSQSKSVKVLLRESTMDNQLPTFVLPQHEKHSTLQSSTTGGFGSRPSRSPALQVLLNIRQSSSIEKQPKHGVVRRRSDNTSHCSDEVCSSHLTNLALQCYLYCEELTLLRARVSYVSIPKHCQFRQSRGRVPVALVSVPGSGNTWVRGLLEKATGVCTGSIYCDIPLRIKGFVGEYVQDGSVLVVKTHTSDYQWRGTRLKKRNQRDSFYDSAILLIRNPFDTFVAERHRSILLGRAEQEAIKSDKLYGVGRVKHTDGSHVHAIDKEEAFGNSSNWKKFSHNIGKRWQKTIIEWSTSNHSVLVVRYEDLKDDSLLQVTRMLYFLNSAYNRTDLMAKLKNGFTAFQRNHTDNYEHYSGDQKREINAMIMDTISILQAHHLDHLFQIREYLATVN